MYIIMLFRVIGRPDMITAPQLFAGILDPAGEENCFFCNGACDTTYKRKDYVKDTFTNRDIVLVPGSDYVCKGCVSSLNQRATINLIDGEIREGQMTQLYSWFFDSTGARAFTKAHSSIIRNLLLNPPDLPFGVVFSTSGRKHLLFRSVLAWDKSEYRVMFEEEKILINVELLKQRLVDAEVLIAAIGKPAIEEMNMNHAMKYYEYYGNLDLFNKWKVVAMQPLNRLAVYISPNQKECQSVHQKRVFDRVDECRSLPAQVSLFD